jgi:acetyltransferase-like isoleucine patch superfamily enzyme
VWIGDDVYLENEYPEQIEIHNGAGIGMRSLLVAHTRGVGRIIIQDDAYIGPGSVVVCPEGRTIRIGKGAMIGPGCIITSSVPEWAYVSAPKSKTIARITIPFVKAASVDEFFCGLRPWKGPPE